MVRLSDFSQALADSLRATPCPEFAVTPFVSLKPLSKRHFALVSTGGLMHLGERGFGPGAGDYRILSRHDPRPIVSSHGSPNFDRTGMQEDINMALPLERFDELVVQGIIAWVADTNYSFMGGTPPEQMENHARSLSRQLKSEGVDSIFLVPI
jgi:D-proline reductase (dithiol) PrdB